MTSVEAYPVTKRVLARVRSLPQRPAWASGGPDVGHDWDGRPNSGFWTHTVATDAGPLAVWQFVAYRHKLSEWEVSAACVDLSGIDELGAVGCRALAAGLVDAAVILEQADREATELRHLRPI